MTRKKQIRREKIHLEGFIGPDSNNPLPKPYMRRVPGPRPYIWIGNERTCFATVSDKSILKLKRWCEEILEQKADRS